jgi:uncharacterized C2H2 Zn-finger protein
MQILYRGIKPEDVDYVGMCSPVNNGCGTRVKFKRSEAKEAGDQRDGYHLEVRCPVCGKTITSNYTKYVEPAPSWHDNR